MMNRRQMLMRLNSLEEATVTGNPAVFNTSVAKPLVHSLIAMEPVQAGSGDPSPQNVRPLTGWQGVKAWHTGKNLINPDDMTAGFINIQDGSINQPDNYQEYTTGFIRTYPNMQVTSGYTKLEGESAWQCIGFYTWDKTFISRPTSSNVISSFNTPQNAYWMRISISTWGHGLDGCYATVGTDATYAPYSGESVEVTFPAVGKNLYNESAQSIQAGKYRGDDGTVGNNGLTSFDAQYIAVRPNTEYTASGFSSTNGKRVYYLDADKGWISRTNAITSMTPTFTTPANCYFIQLQSGNTNTENWTDIQIELGSTATAFEPYTNTVYGGTVDLATGTLTVDRAMVDLGTLGWTKNDASLIGVPCFYATLSGVKGGAPYECCSSYVVKRGRDAITATGQIAPGNASDATYCVVRDDNHASDDAATFKTAMSGVQLVYELATPIVYHLTPQQITALKGDNTLWSNTNGTNTVTYLKKK